MSRAESKDTAGASSTTASTPVFLAERLTLGYGRSVVVRDVQFEVRDGEFWFLLGPNGSGKSTFARAVLGLLRPQSGRIRYAGGLCLGENIGFVPQHCTLHPTLPTTLREYVDLGLGMLRLSAAQRHERVAWALGAVGLSDRIASDLHDLSGGMRQRAMVARALVRRPKLLVLDEPTSNLDPAAQEALLIALAKLHRERGLTILFVCHDVAVAARYATHVAFFHDGVVETGDRGMLMQPERLRAVYGLDICVSLDEAGHATLHIESPEALA